MSGRFRVLSATGDSSEWSAVLAGFSPEIRDLYFDSEWIALHCLDEGAEGLGFVFEEGDEKWFYPFIRRTILCVGGNDISDRGLSDIESAYGYGGPVASTSESDFLGRARLSFQAWCVEERVVAEFIRFHPLLGNERFIGCPDHVTVIDDRGTVAIPVSGNTQPAGYSKNAAYMIRRGKRAGYRVVEASLDDFPRFVMMYRETMKMVDAPDYYYFNEAYFLNLQKLLSRRGRLLAVVGDENEEWVSAGLFLDGESFSHYHLSASLTTRRVPGATNLLLDQAARVAGMSGKTFLHLGGGRTALADDSLFKFKREMGSAECRFHIGKCVHLQDEYYQLIANWEQQGGISEGNPVLLRYRQTV